MSPSFEKSTVTSCFSPSKPNFLPRSNKRDLVDYELSLPFDDYYNANQEIIGNGSDEDNVMKSKPRASKIFNNFKKVKKLVNTLFTFRDKSKEEGKSSSSNVSSCLDKSVTNSEEKLDDFGATIVVDEDYLPCGNESSYNEEFEFDRLEIQPHSYQISKSLMSEILKNTDQEPDVLLKWWKFQEKDYGFAEERNNVDFGKEVDGLSECSSSDLFEIDLHRLLCCEENNDKDDESLTIRHVDDSPVMPSWVPHNLRSIMVELDRDKGIPEPILVVSKRMFPFEVDSCHNRFKIPRLCFGY